MSVGDQIRIRREALGLSLETLASQAEVSVSTVIRTELSHSIPNRATLAVIQRALAEAEHEHEKAKS